MLDLWDWAVADPLLVGFAPWHYGDEPSYGTVMGLGMRDLPETLSVYTELGMRMRRHLSPQLKSDDGMSRASQQLVSVATPLRTCAVGESLGCLREGLPPGGFPGGFQGSCPIRGGPCGRCLPYFAGAKWVAQTSRENCACLCHRQGFALAGVENGANCYW